MIHIARGIAESVQSVHINFLSIDSHAVLRKVEYFDYMAYQDYIRIVGRKLRIRNSIAGKLYAF